MNIQNSFVEPFASPPAYGRAPGTEPEPGRITVIDIHRMARTLAMLRLNDDILVVGCGLAFLRALPDLISAVSGAHCVAVGSKVMLHRTRRSALAR